MYGVTMGFGGAIIALWRGQRVGRKAWPAAEGLKLQKTATGYTIGFWPVGAETISREWHPTTSEILENDWFVHHDPE